MTRILTENAEFQLLEALRHTRRKREQRGEFIIEGVQAITRALAAEWPLRAGLVPAATHRSPWAEACLAQVDTVIEIRPDLFARLTAREEPPELMLLGRIPAPDLAAVPHHPDGVVVVLDRPGNPGNLGTIIRTSDALGAAGVLLSGHGAHLYDPQTVRASVGSLFALPVVPVPSNQALIDWLEQWRATAPVTVYATDEHGEVPLSGAVVLSRPAVILLGSERTGLATALAELADVSLAIPMAGSASSLNVAVAAGIVLQRVMSSVGGHG